MKGDGFFKRLLSLRLPVRDVRNCGSMGHAGLTPPQKAPSRSRKEVDQKVKGSSGGGPWFVLDPFLLTLLAHELFFCGSPFLALGGSSFLRY